MKLKRARLADDLNEKIAQRPGPMELVEKNILPVDSSVKEAIIGKTLNIYSGRKKLGSFRENKFKRPASIISTVFWVNYKLTLALIPLLLLLQHPSVSNVNWF